MPKDTDKKLYVQLCIENGVQDLLTFLIDTGSDISILKNRTLSLDATFNPKEICNIKGISSEFLQTMGLFSSKIIIDTQHFFNQNFHIVSDTFPIICDGILGNDFLFEYLCKIDYGYCTLSIPYSDVDIILDSIDIPTKLCIPARCEKIARIPFFSNLGAEMFCTSKEIVPGVFVGNSLVKLKNNSVTLSLINTNEYDAEVNFSDFSFENTNDYEIYNLNSSWSDEVNDRLNSLKETINLKHLNREEETSILSICRKYNDIFYLTGDKLSATSSTTHKIPVSSECQPIYQRSYRLPESMKEEIHKQVDDMIKNDIIEPSESPWNFPLLVVPKKSNDGEKKWRVVVDFRRLNDVTLDRVHISPSEY